MDRTSERISTYAASLNNEDVTPEALHAVKRSLIDSIGCALGGFSAEPSRIIRRLATRISSTQPASIFGTNIKTSVEMAAFANGAMVRYLDYSDDYVKNDGPHPSDSLPAVLAICEAQHKGGKTFACGLTLAYEIIDQLVDCTWFLFKGYDYAPEHSIGSALGAGKVLGLNKQQMGDALSLSIVPNIALGQTRRGELSMWKACAGPNGARNGLFAALLASEGMTGPQEPIEGVSGLWNKVTGNFKLPPFGGKDRPFKIIETFFKYRPVVYSALLPVEIAFRLREIVNVENIASIKVYVHSRPVGSKGKPEDPEKWDPHTRETADHSVPYCVVAALVDGEVTEKTFEPSRFRDPKLLALLKKLTVEEDLKYTEEFYSTPHTAQYNCRIEITDNSGNKVVEHGLNPKGHPGNPMSDIEIENKFLELSDKTLGSKRARTALDLMWNLENIDDMGKICDIIVF